MSSSSYLVRKPTLARQLEETHETPRSSGDEGMIFLHGLETNHESSLQTKGRLDSLEAAQGAPRIRVATREESGVLGFPSRRGLTPRGSLEWNPDIPAFPGEEY